MSDKKRIAVNSMFLVALTLSNYLIGLLLFPYLSRVLSIEGFGLFGFATAFVLVFQVIVEFGYMISATALVSKSRNSSTEISRVVSTVMLAKILLTGISLALFIVAFLFVPMLRENFLVISLFLVDAFIKAMMPDFYYRGIERMKSITLRTVGVRVLMLILVLLFVKDDSWIVFIPIAFIIADTIALGIAFAGMFKDGVRLHKVALAEVAESIRSSFMFFVSRLAVSVNQSIGALILGFKYTPNSIELGIFSGATRIATASELLIPAVSDSLYPHMVNKKDYRLFHKIVLVGGILWLFVCVGVFIFASEICTILLGGDYAEAGNLLRILVFGSFVALFSNFYGYPALSPLGKAKHANMAILVSAVINVVACSVLWVADFITVTNVCIVLATTNISAFVYRFVVFRVYYEKSKSLS